MVQHFQRAPYKRPGAFKPGARNVSVQAKHLYLIMRTVLRPSADALRIAATIKTARGLL